VLNFINEITPLQDKASLSIFTREEASDQPFVFVYDVDDSNRLVVIDAHDIYIVLSMDYLLYILLFPLPIHFHFLYRLILCDGSDKFPFILSMTSKALLSVLLSASSSLLLFMFHMDSSFTCNKNEFPFTLWGFIDAQRQFHLLSISVVSHRTQHVYRWLISSLQELVSKVMPGYSSSFQYCITDYEAVER
jgi:hypothetical protein